jgi:hypothetical protein
MIALACGTNPVKTLGSKKFLTRLQQTLDGWRQEDPPTSKKLPVKSDIPEYLVNKPDIALQWLLTKQWWT